MKDLEKRTTEVRGASNEIENEQDDGMQARYNNLTLRMKIALVDMSKAINYPTSQFEGNEELEKAMKKARVGPSTSSFYEKHHGEIGLLELQQHLESRVLKEA